MSPTVTALLLRSPLGAGGCPCCGRVVVSVRPAGWLGVLAVEDQRIFEAGWILPLQAGVLHLFADCIPVVVILRGFREEEQVLMGFGWSVLDALWHWVGLVPDDVAAQVPAVLLERECD